MKLINCGCSFAHGHNSKPLDYSPIQQKGLSKTGTKDSDVSAWQSAGWHLAMDYKMDYIDLARNGNSNEGILRTLRTYLHKNNKEDLFVLIGWTHAFRREYMSVVVDKNKNEFTQYREIPSSKSPQSSIENNPGKKPTDSGNTNPNLPKINPVIIFIIFFVYHLFNSNFSNFIYLFH